jgi:hypothetical protein
MRGLNIRLAAKREKNMKPYESPFGYSPEELSEDPEKLRKVSDEIAVTMKRIRKSRENKSQKDANKSPANRK